jgi:hypothetical protein
MRAHASVSPWLPILSAHLGDLVLLGGRATELYHLSLLERRAPAHPEAWTFFGVARGGAHPKGLADDLLRQGFRKRAPEGPGAMPGPAYHRGDLGWVQFLCPRTRSGQTAAARGLAAVPEPFVHLEMESPHPVEVTYLGTTYPVKIPAAGRFALAHALRLPAHSRREMVHLYTSARSLGWLLELLACHEELEEEALGDLLEVRPPALLRSFRERLKLHGPGSALWTGSMTLLEAAGSSARPVALESWYWRFLGKLSRLERERKSGR